MESFALTKQDTSVMKGIAICAMLLHHLYGYPPYGVLPYDGILQWLGVLGKVCVALFLFCSGYGLSANYKPQSILGDLKFIAKRLVKFYANYWVIFLIFVPLSLVVFHQPADAYANQIWLNPIALCKSILGFDNAYNVTWWFNSVILEFYILFPILYRLIRLKPWVAIIIGMILMRLENHMPFDTVWQYPFIIGIVWQLYEDKLPKLSAWLIEHKIIFALSPIFLFLLMVIMRMYSIIPHWTGVRMDAFVTCTIALVILSIFQYSSWMKIVFSFLGKHSMNIYWIHTFFNAYWFTCWLHTGGFMRSGGSFLALLSICLGISVVFEYIKNVCGLNNLVNIISTKLK